MLQIVSLILSLIFCLTGFGSSAAAQTVEQETVAISDSALAMINLPTGARRIKEGNVPAEVQSTLAKLVAAGGGRVRQNAGAAGEPNKSRTSASSLRAAGVAALLGSDYRRRDCRARGRSKDGL